MNTVALIILNYNSSKDTIFCVHRLLSFKKMYKIVVVDNCSTDDSFDVIRNNINDSRVDIIKTDKNGGYSAGNNYGIRYAVEKYGVSIVGILNPDIIIENENTIPNLVQKLMSNEKYAIIGGATKDSNGVFNINYAAWDVPTGLDVVLDHSLLVDRKKKNPKFKQLDDGLVQVGCIAGCFFLAKVDKFLELGLLDENVFLYNEENILGIKCRNAQYIEVVDINEPYIHNHIHRTNGKIKLIKKIKSTTNAYISRKYMCKLYYSKRLLPLLWMVEMVNKLYLVACYLKNIGKKG